MSLEIIGTAPDFAGKTVVAKANNSLIDVAPFHKPIWDDMLYLQSNKWWLTSFLKKYKRDKPPIASNTWNWAEDGKWYKKLTIAADGSDDPVVSISGTTITFAYQQDKYIFETDVIDLGVKYGSLTNVQARVTATSVNVSGQQVVTATIKDPQGTLSLAASDFTVGHEISLSHNSQGECFVKPKSRYHTPEKKSNALCKISHTHGVCDDADNQEFWFRSQASGNYYHTPYQLEGWMEFHNMSCDAALLLGQEHAFVDSDAYSGVEGKGMLQFLEQESLKMQTGGAVIENDLIDFMTELARYSKVTEWDFIMGDLIAANVTKTLDRYALGGATKYGTYELHAAGQGKAGISFNEYVFNGKKIRLMVYEGFSDPDFLPSNDNGVDYRKMGIALQKDSACVRYKKSRKTGQAVKMMISKFYGHSMGHQNVPVSNERACDEYVFTTHVGLEMKGLQSNGVLCEA